MIRKSKNENKKANLRKRALKRRLRSTMTNHKLNGPTAKKDYFHLKGKNAENILHELAEKTFLADWCYPNPVLSDGKELCDLLVVFDDIAIIWQLKDTMLDDDGNIKDSDIQKNQRQLLGARRQLFELKTDITLTNPRRGQESFNSSHIKHVHLISAFFGDRPFIVSTREKVKGHLIHTFTRDFTEIALNELDTISDFQRYLQDREQLSNAKTSLVVIGGEEQVLGYYLANNRCFDEFESRDVAVLGDDIWEGLKNNPKYRAKKEADEISYLWDSIINRSYDGDSPQYELIARELAQHDRLGRRMLAKAYFDAHKIAHDKNETFRRYTIMEDLDVVYCFLFQDDPEPRENRKAHLTAMCHVARSRHLDKKIIGIAAVIIGIIGLGLTEAIIRPQCSYDFALINIHKWSEEDQKALEKIQANTDILKNPKQQHVHDDEYPA